MVHYVHICSVFIERLIARVSEFYGRLRGFVNGDLKPSEHYGNILCNVCDLPTHMDYLDICR